MIENYERLRINVSKLLDYTYPEDLPEWKTPTEFGIDIDTAALNISALGKCCFINNGLVQRLFLLDLLKKPISGFVPIAFLSTLESNRREMNEVIISAMIEMYPEEKVLYDGLSNCAIKSKKLHCRRFCELEDELRELSTKGYRIVVISNFEELPYLDAESKAKGYLNIPDAIRILSCELGMNILILYQDQIEEMRSSTILEIFVKPRKYLPPRKVSVECNSKIVGNYLFSCSKKMMTEGIGSFRFEKC